MKVLGAPLWLWYLIPWMVSMVIVMSTIDGNDELAQFFQRLYARGNTLGITYLVKWTVVTVIMPLIFLVMCLLFIVGVIVPNIFSWLFTRPEGDTDD